MSVTCNTPGCVRETWNNDECCIFHSRDIEGKKDDFKNKFWEEFQRQNEAEKEYDFTGFIFPDDISFEGITFDKDVNFSVAQFNGEADFSVAKFNKLANFDKAKFNGEAFFRGVQFAKGASFYLAEFSEFVSFGGTIFSKVNFEVTQFSKFVSFGEAHFERVVDLAESRFSGDTDFTSTHFHTSVDFSKVNFSGFVTFEDATFSMTTSFMRILFPKNVSYKKTKFLKEVNFSYAQFREHANFKDIIIKKYDSFKMEDTYFYDVSGLLEFIDEKKENFIYSNRTEFLPDNFELILGESAAARHPIFSKKIRDDIYLLRYKKNSPKAHYLWWISSKFGKSFLRWAVLSLGIAFVFGLIYSPYPDWAPNCWKYLCEEIGPQFAFTSEKVSSQPPEFFSLLYFSIVTFTTLGFGDIAAINATARILVTVEGIIGYIMLGGLVSIMATKLARRS